MWVLEDEEELGIKEGKNKKQNKMKGFEKTPWCLMYLLHKQQALGLEFKSPEHRKRLVSVTAYQ